MIIEQNAKGTHIQATQAETLQLIAQMLAELQKSTRSDKFFFFPCIGADSTDKNWPSVLHFSIGPHQVDSTPQ